MKISEYPTTQSLNNVSKFLVENSDGTRTITRSDLISALFDDIPEMHSVIYRGKYLGVTPSTNQMNAIRNGTFKDIYLGDYWENRGFKWIVSDFNYWKFLPEVTDNHIVITTDKNIGGRVQAHNNNTNHSYVSSWLYQSYIPTIKTQIQNSFTSSFVTHPEYFSRGFVRYPSPMVGGAAIDSTRAASVDISILSERMLTGTVTRSINGAANTSSLTNSYRQLALFRVAGLPNSDGGFWLTDTADIASLMVYAEDGVVRHAQMNTNQFGIRPVFAIG